MNERKNKSSFIKQAAILAAAALLSRFIGFLYRIPLTDMIGDVGMGIYNFGYQIYNFFLVISSAGLPAAISKMVSERIALKQYRNAHKIFEISLAAATAVGLLCALFLFAFAGQISDAMANPESSVALLTLAPTIVLIAVLSVFRGYFQGMGNSTPTAFSQILEQIVNAVTSLLLAWNLMRIYQEVKYGAAGGTAGTGIGAAFGVLLILFVYNLNRPGIKRRIASEKGIIVSEGKRKILKELVFTAFPIIAGTAIFSFTNLIDSQMVMSRLQEYLTNERTLALYGQLTNKFVSITTLPVSISSAMATGFIPGIAASRVLAKKQELSIKINTGMRIAMMISIPAAVGLSVLSSQILLLLFKNYPEGGMMLTVGAISVIFLSLYQISTGMLQALGKLHIPVIAAIAGVVVKIPLNYFLLGNPQINIMGAVVGTIGCYVVASAVDIFFLIKITKIKLDFSGMLLKPGIASLIMGMACYISYHLSYYLFPSNTLCTILSIAVGVASYFIAMLLIGGFKKSDISMIPMGAPILRALGRLGLKKYLR